MATRTVEIASDVLAPTAAVWERVVDPDAINDEMRPWLTMRMPRRAAGLTVDTLPLGQPLGRAWLRLFGVVPFDFDHLTVVEVEAGTRFHLPAPASGPGPCRGPRAGGRELLQAPAPSPAQALRSSLSRESHDLPPAG